jgi:hypothetical protein
LRREDVLVQLAKFELRLIALDHKIQSLTGSHARVAVDVNDVDVYVF